MLVSHLRCYWSSLSLHPFLHPSCTLIAFSAVKLLSLIEESSTCQQLVFDMSIEEQKKESCDDGRQDDSLLAHKKQDTGRQPESDNCFNSLSDTEEHFEFSPDMSDEPVDPHAGESGHGSKLSSDSFRSTSSASSLGNGGVCSNNNHPFPRDNHLRQSFTSRTTSWGPRSSRRSLNSHHRSKYTSANGHARQTLTCSSGNSPSSRRSSLSDEAISSNDPASLEDHVQYMTDKVSASFPLLFNAGPKRSF